jgi:hypothetical protein
MDVVLEMLNFSLHVDLLHIDCINLVLDVE